MGYRIAYEPHLESKYPARLKANRHIRIVWLTAAIILCVIAYKYKDPLIHWLISGNTGVARQAFRYMIDSLQSGTSFNDAATAFCLKIIENAQ